MVSTQMCSSEFERDIAECEFVNRRSGDSGAIKNEIQTGRHGCQETAEIIVQFKEAHLIGSLDISELTLGYPKLHVCQCCRT